MCEVAELTVSLVSYSTEELGQLSPIEARCRDLARHLGDGPFWRAVAGVVTAVIGCLTSSYAVERLT